MKQFHTHLCLVSAQATPNLLPVLDERWRPKRVVLACTTQMKTATLALKEVIRTKCQGVQVDELELPSAYDYAALADAFLVFLAENQDEDIAVNVTGGTKLMAVAAQEVFRANGKPAFYVNADSDEVVVIGEKAISQPLSATLKVNEMLAVHRYPVAGQQRPQVTREQRDLAARLIDHVDGAGQALGSFNALAKVAESDLRVEMNDSQYDSRALSQIIALFEEANYVKQNGHTLKFTNEAARAFANGGWLEFHVYEALQALRAQHQGLADVALNVKVAYPKAMGGTEMNEIDVAFLHRNTLHLIECKTANLALPGSAESDKGTDAIYKVESLLKLGGLRTKAMIVDYRGKLSSSPANLKRAKDANIVIASGPQLRDLKGFISRLWLSAPAT